MLIQGSLLQNRDRIVQPLGSGGQGAVYLAQHLGLNTYVAIKEIFSNDPHSNARFQTEANLLAHLSHPNLPRVTDFFIEPNGARYLVMEYVQGENLEMIVQRRGAPVPESEALNWFRQIFDAVKYLHANRVIHRDIKPHNIIITPQHRAVLVDFGIAKVMASGALTGASMRFGSPGFASPEQYSGGTDERSDIYSLGATLYFALTGQTPPEAPLRASGVKVIPPRELNAGISPNVERVVLKAMSLDAAMRYAKVSDIEQVEFGKEASVLSSRTRVIKSSSMWFFGVVGIAILILIGWVGCTGILASSITGTVSPTITATFQVAMYAPTLTPTSTATYTPTAANTVTDTASQSATHTATFTFSYTPTAALSKTPTRISPTSTATPTVQPTLTTPFTPRPVTATLTRRPLTQTPRSRTATPISTFIYNPPDPFDPPNDSNLSRSTILRWNSSHALQANEVFDVLVWPEGTSEQKSIGTTRDTVFPIEFASWGYPSNGRYFWRIRIKQLDGRYLSAGSLPLAFNVSETDHSGGDDGNQNPPPPPPQPTEPKPTEPKPTP